MSLPFRQLNMHKALLASVELNKVLAREPSVCLLTEPCAAFNKVCKVPSNHVALPNNTMLSRPRTAIYIPKGFPHVYLEQLSNPDCTVALLDTAGGKVLLASCYLDSKKAVVQPWLRKLFQFVETKKYPSIVAFDCNAHSELYHTETNDRGKEFEEFILEFGLHLENRGVTPTYHAFRGGESIDTCIDVTLTKRSPPLQNWRVHSHTFNGSDHHSITWSLPVERVPPPLIRPWSKADWNLFKDKVASYDFQLPQNLTTIKTDKLLDRWYQVIEMGLDAACPKRQARSAPVDMDWYGKNQKFLKNRVKRKYLSYRNALTSNARKAFVKAKRAYRHSCIRGRKEAWQMFVEKTPNETNMARLFRIAQHRDKRSINTLLKADGSLTDPGLETIQCLTSAHFPAATPGTTPLSLNSQHKIDTSILQGKYSKWISEPLVRKAIKKFKPNKAAGPDGLKPIVLQHLPDNAIMVLTLIFKACIALSHTPRKWRSTKVIFLPKPGKKSFDIPKAYRPISLSNFALKVLERLCVWKADKAMEHFPIHPNQHGFLKGKSTDSALSKTVDYIEQNIFEDQLCLGMFLDISSAFDSISIHHIKQSLLDHGVDHELVAWYYSYLGTRFIEVNLHGETAHLTTATGFPQGGVCSARFWLIAFDEAIRIINTRGITGTGYADDCSALLGGTHIDNMIEAMQAMLDGLVAWGRTCGLQFNAQKTVAVIFTRSTRVFERRVRMDGELIPYSDTVVYLGITLDKELKWRHHILLKIDKAKNLLMKMAALTSSYWGPRPKLLRWAFTGIVRPMITYGAIVWGPAAEQDWVEKALRRLNRLAMSTIVRVPRSTPTEGLEVILGVKPLHLHIKYEGFASYNRLKNQLPLTWDGVYPNLTFSVSHLRFWEYLAEDVGISDFQAGSDSCHVPRPDLHFVLDINSFVNMADCQGRAAFNVYTDGSKMNDKVGAGVYILCGGARVAEKSYRLPDQSTVYQAEMMAIREAASILAGIQGLTTVKFFVDSQAALRTFQAMHITSKLALQTIQTINTVKAESITFVWTKAHVGTFGNEKADRLAKAGTELEEVHAIPAPACNAVHKIAQYIQTLWDTE